MQGNLKSKENSENKLQLELKISRNTFPKILKTKKVTPKKTKNKNVK